MRHVTHNIPTPSTAAEDNPHIHPDLRSTEPPPPPPSQTGHVPPPVYDFESGLVWVPWMMDVDMKSQEIAFENMPQEPVFPDQNQQPLSQGSTSGATNNSDVIIVPSSQRRTRQQSNTLNATPSRPTTPYSSPIKGRSISSTTKKKPSKTWRDNDESTKLVPGLYKQIGAKAWTCLFRDPCSRDSTVTCCGAVLIGNKELQRHIDLHAKREQALIDDGDLSPQEAIALPRQVLMEYECEDPDCGYLKEHGKPYRHVDYRVDNQKAWHKKKYHS